MSVDRHRDGHVLHLVINQPERRNALSISLLADITRAIAEDGSHRATILSGAAGNFSAGADLADLTGTEADEAMDEAISHTTEAIREAAVPVVAAIEGACIGAAVDVALACDLRVAAQDAFFQVPATRLGILYNPEAVKRMVAVVGTPPLRLLLLTGRRVPASVALQLGIVAELAPTGEATATATSLANAICENDPIAVSATKRLLGAVERSWIDRGHWDEAEWKEHYRRFLASPGRAAAVREAKGRVMKTPETNQQ